MKTSREEQFKERVRIAKAHLSTVPYDAEAIEDRIKRFDEIATQTARPYAKSHVMQAVDRDQARLDIEARFAALANPIGQWMLKRVIVLGERDAIVEFYSNVSDGSQQVGDLHFVTILNDDKTNIVYDTLDTAMLHYLSAKHEGRGAAFQGSFVRYAMGMLKQGEDE